MDVPALHTDRIRLRAPEPEDLDIMFAFENDEALWGNGIATGPYSRYQLKKYICESQNNLFADGQLRLMIELDTREVAGIVDLFSYDNRHRRAEIGLVVREDCRRRGIAREALRLLELHSFGLLGIHQLYAYVRKDNAAGMSFFEAAGYNVAGILADWLYSGSGYKDVCILQKVSP